MLLANGLSIFPIKQGFPNSGKWWGRNSPPVESEILWGGGGDLRRSDFEDSNLFQS